MGQLYLPHDSYILSAEVARVVRQALEFATWGKEFGREEEVRRRPARAVLSLLACKGPGPLQSLVAQSLVAQSNVDGLVAHCSLLGLCTWRWPTKSSSYEIRMNLPISGD